MPESFLKIGGGRATTFLLAACIFALSALAAADPAETTVTLDANTRRQPAGGAFVFTVAPPPQAKPSVKICASINPQTGCLAPLLVDVVEVNDKKATYKATLPEKLDWPSRLKPFYGFFDRPNVREYASEAVARADLVVTMNGTDSVLPVGVTSRAYAAVLAIVIGFLAAFIVAKFASQIGVPSPRRSGEGPVQRVAFSPFRIGTALLKPISSADGVASLSQFQVLLWTFVVAGGAVYVAVLNNALITITPTVLALLGVAGLAGVLTEVKKAQSGLSAGYDKPGPVQDLSVEAASDSELRVKWRAPGGSAPIDSYLVKRSADPAETNDTLTGPTITGIVRSSVRLVGLRGDTAYRVKVWATNPAGDGDPVYAQRTTAQGPAAAELPAAPSNVATTPDDATETTLPLQWGHASSGQADFEVQQRRLDSDDPWTPARLRAANPPRTSPVVVVGLQPGASYQFRVRVAGGLWSPPETFSTIRYPRWSDLVTEGATPSEIDVSRVQMIIFTLIIAGFVVTQIIDTSAIPDISSNYLVLMGISNGVYITTKFVRR